MCSGSHFHGPAPAHRLNAPTSRPTRPSDPNARRSSSNHCSVRKHDNNDNVAPATKPTASAADQHGLESRPCPSDWTTDTEFCILAATVQSARTAHHAGQYKQYRPTSEHQSATDPGDCETVPGQPISAAYADDGTGQTGPAREPGDHISRLHNDTHHTDNAKSTNFGVQPVGCDQFAAESAVEPFGTGEWTSYATEATGDAQGELTS